MFQTIRDVMAREAVRQMPQAQPQPQDDTDDEALISPEDVQQELDEQENGAGGSAHAMGEGEFPMHEVNANPQRYPVDQAKAYHSFLKNAAGGTGTFTTANPESHEIAKNLARSGHLQHHGSRPGGAGGGIRHVWSLTPKGMAAIGQGQVKKPGMGNRQGAVVRRPGL